MKRKRNLETRIFLILRRLGYLCKKPKAPERRLRISQTINADGTITVYDTYPKEVPVNVHSLNSEINVYLQERKLARPNCKFDTNSMSCPCGRTMNEFLDVTLKCK